MPDFSWFSLFQQTAELHPAAWPQWLPGFCALLLAPLLLFVALRACLRERRRRREETTRQRRAADRCALLENRLEQAERLGKIGFWSWEAAGDRLTLSPQVLRLHELNPHPAMPIDSFDALLSAYAPPGRAALQAAWERALTQGHGWEMTLPLLRTATETESGSSEELGESLPRWARPLQDVRAEEEEQITEDASSESAGAMPAPAPRQLRIMGEPIIEKGVLLGIRGSFQDVSHQRDHDQLQSLLQNTAEVARRTQSTFLAQLGQEIGRPLNEMISLCELLLDPQAEAQDRQQAARTIRRQGQHLARRISDRLDAARIQAGTLEVSTMAVDTRRLLQETLEQLAPQARERGLGLHLIAPEPIPATIQSDPMRLRQALHHLIGQALQTSAHGSVRLEVHFDGVENLLHLNVVDRGPGHSRQEMDQALRPLQIDEALVSSRRHPASEAHLGLFIAHHIAQRLGGGLATQTQLSRLGHQIRMTLATGPVPTGTLIRLSDLDVAAPAGNEPATSEPPVASPATALDSPARTPASASALAPGVTPPAPRPEAAQEATSSAAAPARTRKEAPNHPAAPALEGLRVLIVEDSLENQRLLQTLLARSGAETATAQHGLDGMERALDALHRDEAFDAVLMDMQMPVMDGYAAAARLREEGYPGPILGLTAQSIGGEEARCLAAGCDAIVSKPIDPAALLDAIQQLVSMVPR